MSGDVREWFGVRGLQTCLTGIGQIMLQRSAWAGALFLVGIALHSRVMLIGALIGVVAGMSTARILHLATAEQQQQGLYGFNGALVGIVVLFQLPLSAVAVLLIVAGGALASALMAAGLRRRALPPYTAPFVLAAWLVLAVIALLDLPRTSITLGPNAGVAAAVSRSIGQVMFQDDWRTGCVFLLGIAAASPRAAAWATLGGFVGFLMARGFDFPAARAAAGLYGFNAVLAAIALGADGRRRIFPPLAGSVLAVLLTRALELAGIPPLTAPFVLATWLVLAADRWCGVRAL